MYIRYLTAFGPTIDGRSVLPFNVRHMTIAPAEQTGFGRVDLLLGIIDDDSKSTAHGDATCLNLSPQFSSEAEFVSFGCEEGRF